MFRRLKLSVNWVQINNSSSGISIFLFNLYLQQSNMGNLEFRSLCRTAGCCTTKWHNTEKGDSYIPSTSQPHIHPNLPVHTCWNSQVARSEVLSEGGVGDYRDGNKGKLLPPRRRESHILPSKNLIRGGVSAFPTFGRISVRNPQGRGS